MNDIRNPLNFMVGQGGVEPPTLGFSVNSRAPPSFLPCSLLSDIVGKIVLIREPSSPLLPLVLPYQVHKKCTVDQKGRGQTTTVQQRTKNWAKSGQFKSWT